MFEKQFIDLIDGRLSVTESLECLRSTVEMEFTGPLLAFAAQAMRDRMIRFPYSQPVMDTCGTGGDQQSTVNLSTASAIVLAACGIKVAKHGNRAVSSTSGSSDVLAQLGIAIDITSEQVQACLEHAHVGFLFAPKYHPYLKGLAPLRKQLGKPTIFNLLGPLCNPAMPVRQLLGVGKLKHARPVADALRLLKVEKAMVVHGEPGLDEVSLDGTTQIWIIEGDDIQETTVSPDHFGLKTNSIENIRCRDAAESAIRIQNCFQCATSESVWPWLMANAAIGLVLADRAKNWLDGIHQTTDVVLSGHAQQTLEQLRKLSVAAVASLPKP